MAAFQRIILLLIAIYAVLSVGALPLVAVRVSNSLSALISSERADRDLMIASLLTKTLRAVS